MVSKLDMVLVTEGHFLMGADETSSEEEEKPQKKIWLSTYAIQKTPVTVGQWSEFLRDSGYDWSYSDEEADKIKKILKLVNLDFDKSLSNQVAQVSLENDYPIVFVSWFDACEFTKWLGETLGGAYALPTDAQWEKACRGKNGQLYPWGNEELDYYEDRYFSQNSFTMNQRVGLCHERQSPYGCLDMWQNVSEWCRDWYDISERYYRDTDTEKMNPSGPAIGEYVGDYKVFRGGWFESSGFPRCTYRSYQSPKCRDPKIGFRVVLNY